MPEPINVFIIYAREDREIKQGLLRHLNPLKDSYNLSIWHDDHIEPGQEWKPSIESRLEKTDLFLMLVSADFMNSEFIHQVEFKFAIDRHKQNKSIVIPVIIDYCLWDVDIAYKNQTFNLKDLQVLPDEAKPIGDWRTPEQAYSNIARGIRTVLMSIQDKRRQASTKGAEVHTASQEQQENIKNKKLTKDRDEILQRQIAGQEEKDNAPGNPAVTIPEDEGNKGGLTKKIIYFAIIAVVVALLAYFIFHKADNKVQGEEGGRDTGTMVTSGPLNANNIDTSFNTGNGATNPESPAVDPASSVRDHRTITNVPVNSFNTFPDALAAVLRDAANNFANLKGTYVGMDDGMRKYKSTLILRNKAFAPAYLLQNGSEWKFVFANRNNSSYEAIKSAVVSVLKNKKINFQYESSASMGFEKYTWNNEAFEINLSVRKYTDNFVEIALYHRG